ncbi:MAG: flippase-like domain-containing protein [Candidatus Bathyarchaeia archaeon]
MRCVPIQWKSQLTERKVELLSNRPKFKTWVSLLAISGFSVFIIYLFLFTDIAQVAIVIGQVNIPIYLIAFLCIIAEMVFNALEWKATLDNVAVKTTLKRIWNLSWVGFFLDSLIPGGLSGDLFIIYLLSKDKGVDGVKAAASMVIKDILELLVVFISLIIGIILLILNYSVGGFLLFAIGVTMVFLSLPLVIVVYLSTNVSATKRLLKFLVKTVAKIRHRKPNDKFENKLEEQITDFHDVIMIIKTKPRTMIKPMFYQTMAWIFDILALYFVFVALGTTVGADKILITNSIVNNVRSQGVALAGFSQIVSTQLYGILGINLSLAEASSLLSGFANFWFRLVISFVFFERYGLGTVAEKLLSKALKLRKKEARKVFKEQTQSDKDDFQNKRESDKQDYDDKRDSDEKAFNDGRDSDKQDYDDKRDSDEKDYEGKRDSDKQEFKEKERSMS